MKQEALKYFTDTHLTAIGLLLFFGFFVCTILWVYRKHSNTHYARMTQIPLQMDGDSK